MTKRYIMTAYYDATSPGEEITIEAESLDEAECKAADLETTDMWSWYVKPDETL